MGVEGGRRSRASEGGCESGSGLRTGLGGGSGGGRAAEDTSEGGLVIG